MYTIGIVVLSLFDGISCGQIALERAGIKVEKYYASEIEKNAIEVTQKNYPNTIQLGDVNNWRDWNINWPDIDLLLGGSPCCGFSSLGKKLNFHDARSRLFFIYADILNHIKKINPTIKFLLENVQMKQQYKEEINLILGISPISINSSLLSAQNRPRLYWTNIQGVTIPQDKQIMLTDILLNQADDEFYIKNRKRSTKFVSRKYSEFKKKLGYTPKMFNPYNCSEIKLKSPTLTAQGSRISVSSTVLIDNGIAGIRMLTPVEWERLQTLPDNYTQNIKTTERFNVIGNAWTVDVVSHILKSLN